MKPNAWLGLCLMTLVPQWAAAAPSVDVLSSPALQSQLALHAALQDITRAGDRLVAVGERGTVLLSDDNGTSWRQVPVPISSSLTAVQFVDARNGWAVGHAGVVLHSSDGGERWTLQLDGRRLAQLELDAAQASGDEQHLAAARQGVADGADKPLLALAFSDANHGLVVGAYGLALHTSDGGASWVSWAARLPNPQGLHLYAVAQSPDGVYIAGEQGLFLRSQDAGEHFNAMSTPYQGSYFSLAVQPDGALHLGGLRGRVFRSTDQGSSFESVQNPVPISINDMQLLGNRLFLVNQAGGVLRSSADRARLTPLALPPGPPLTAVAEAADGALVGVGFAGPVRLATSLNAAE
ncbi:YCF48-related protein [Pseudomonas sp. CFBP 13719]|uniref:YCF48-related protein n=1 Tax=Pseudomonas sp. CFBP 13719 TaxID=2775303 RepID=UPI0017817E23|nr:BNR domain-containing protein [Pseudomonas sp. CFBP 13719]